MVTSSRDPVIPSPEAATAVEAVATDHVAENIRMIRTTMTENLSDGLCKSPPYKPRSEAGIEGGSEEPPSVHLFYQV